MLATALLNVLLVTPTVAGAPVSAAVECTFEHPGFTGTCVEQATPEDTQTPRQACEVILACLNDARCVKTYCQATTLRGGWSLRSAKPPDAAARVSRVRGRPRGSG
jgi:hypothetical protein